MSLFAKIDSNLPGFIRVDAETGEFNESNSRLEVVEGRMTDAYDRLIDLLDDTTKGLLTDARTDFETYGKKSDQEWVTVLPFQYDDGHTEVLVMVKMVHKGIHTMKNLTINKYPPTNSFPKTYSVDETDDEGNVTTYHYPDVVGFAEEILSIPRVLAAVIKIVASEYDDNNNSIYNNIDFLELMIKTETSLNHLDKMEVVEDTASMTFLNTLFNRLMPNLHNEIDKVYYSIECGFVAFDPVDDNNVSYWGISIMNGTETVATKVYTHNGTYQLRHFLLFDKNSEIRDYCDKLAFNVIYPAMNDFMHMAKVLFLMRYFEESFYNYDYMANFIPLFDDLFLSYGYNIHSIRYYPDAQHIANFLYVLKTDVFPAMKAAYPDFLEEEINMEVMKNYAYAEAVELINNSKEVVENWLAE